MSKPNDWSQSVAQAARAISDAELSETRILQRAYWDAFQSVLNSSGGPVSGNRKPQPASWMSFPIGRSSFHLNGVMARTKKQIRAELYITGDRAKSFLGLLEQQKAAIEEETGYLLEWMQARIECRIAINLDDVDPGDEADWPRQREWLAKRLNDLHRVFASRVKALDADDWEPESD